MGPSSAPPSLARSAGPARAQGVRAQGWNLSGERGGDRTVTVSGTILCLCPSDGQFGERAITYGRFSLIQFNFHLLSISCVPGTVLGAGDTHKAITQLGTARSALWGPRLIFLVHLIPPLQPLFPGLELEKKALGREERKEEGRQSREQGERPERWVWSGGWAASREPLGGVSPPHLETLTR